MAKPALGKIPTADELAAMKAAKAQQLNGKIIFGSARISKADGTNVNFYILEDLSEVCQDDLGNPATWPDGK